MNPRKRERERERERERKREREMREREMRERDEREGEWREKSVMWSQYPAAVEGESRSSATPGVAGSQSQLTLSFRPGGKTVGKRFWTILTTQPPHKILLFLPRFLIKTILPDTTQPFTECDYTRTCRPLC